MIKKNLIALVAACAALTLNATLNAQNPSPTPAPIAVPTPATQTVKLPVTLTLSAAQVAELVSTLQTAGVTLPPGITNLNLHVVTSGTNAGGAVVMLRFQ